MLVSLVGGTKYGHDDDNQKMLNCTSCPPPVDVEEWLKKACTLLPANSNLTDEYTVHMLSARKGLCFGNSARLMMIVGIFQSQHNRVLEIQTANEGTIGLYPEGLELLQNLSGELESVFNLRPH
jgi:hypothetical protein